ncbi:FUSC family protein [Micromonospora sp. WMMD710]|uniref:FUSC family protein n=1 Tax=Micromonospora sp. WMMD710 TaxID=3016085 RepID=UPI0024172454|nr:FUSC family protein [Micromonospora sp. WMMD710]MDG4757265.1 FUSC family protein [Micromonospora sp. WMMD710]
MRRWGRDAIARLRGDGMTVIELTAAAVVAWIVAAVVIRHPDPFYAPTAALVVLGESRGRRLRQTVEILLAVAAAVLVAELLVYTLGPGTDTVLLVLVLTTTTLVLIGARRALVVQATVSAMYLVVVAAPHGTLMPFRFVDALIGGAVALAASQLMATRDPLAPLVAQARRSYTDLADLLDQVNAALQGCDEDAARAALDQARQVDDCVAQMQAAVLATGETLRLGLRRRHLGKLVDVEATLRQLDYAARNIRVLARAGVTLTRRHTATPPELAAAIGALTAAVRSAGEALARDLSGADADRHAHSADAAALKAVRIAAGLLRSDPPLPVTMIVGQIRATAIDLLRGVGHDDVTVLDRVDEALGLSRA